jgi:hypothetical protein
VAIGGVGDNDTDGGGVEDGLEAGLALAQGFFSSFVVVDVFKCAVPTDDLAVFAPSRGGACSHPSPFRIVAANAVLGVEEFAGTKSFFPRSESRLKVVGVKSTNPTLSQRLLFCEAGKSLPPVAGVEDHSIGVRGPRDLRTEFNGIAVVVFAFNEGLFGLLAAGDVDDGDGDSDDLVYFVAGWLIRDEDGAGQARPMRVGVADFETGMGYAVERTEEIGLALRELFRNDLGDVAAEVRGDGEIVHLGETPVHADVTQVAIKIAESDGDAIVNSIELGKALGGKSFKSQRKSGIRSRRLGFGRIG